MSNPCPKCGFQDIPEPPMYSVVKDTDGDTWQRQPGGWVVGVENDRGSSGKGASWESLLVDLGPLTLIHYVPERVE